VAPAALAALTAAVAPVHDPASDAVKQALRAQHRRCRGAGPVWRAHLVTLHGRHFWGLDALPMLRDALQGERLVRRPRLGQRSGNQPPGLQRR
jgi:2-hydroxychromene-2-carboxylate isomerase